MSVMYGSKKSFIESTCIFSINDLTEKSKTPGISFTYLYIHLSI